jgi:hypothetical protein
MSCRDMTWSSILYAGEYCRCLERVRTEYAQYSSEYGGELRLDPDGRWWRLTVGVGVLFTSIRCPVNLPREDICTDPITRTRRISLNSP